MIVSIMLLPALRLNGKDRKEAGRDISTFIYKKPPSGGFFMPVVTTRFKRYITLLLFRYLKLYPFPCFILQSACKHCVLHPLL